MDLFSWSTNYMPDLSNTSLVTIDPWEWDVSDTMSESPSTTMISNPTPSAIQFVNLNALPQSFITLWLGQTQDVQIDPRQIIFSPNTARVVWSGDSKRFVGWDVSNVGIMADELIFYNDPSWTNILVVMEITRNQQSYLLQVPFGVWRDDKKYLNQLIGQVTK